MDSRPASHVQKFSVLGSTGSIGTQTLDIIREHKDHFELVAIAAGGNVKLLAEQVSHCSHLMVQCTFGGGTKNTGKSSEENDLPQR